MKNNTSIHLIKCSRFEEENMWLYSIRDGIIDTKAKVIFVSKSSLIHLFIYPANTKCLLITMYYTCYALEIYSRISDDPLLSRSL